MIIIGGGFAGLSAYRKAKNPLLIDKDRYFEYTPSLHLCILSEYEKKIKLDLQRFNFKQEKVLKIEKDKVITDKNEYRSDTIIQATGATTKKFNESFKNAYEFKRIEDVNKINKKLKTAKKIIIIGGGYTGVELASMIKERKDCEVTIIHSGKYLLHTVSEKAGKMTEHFFKKKGIKIIYDRAKKINKDSVETKDKKIYGDLIINTAGITPNDLGESIKIGDVSRREVLKTAHNAMIEGRNIDKLIEKKDFKHKDWRILAIALGEQKGIITFGNNAIYLPFVGFLKKIIEKRVMIEFKYKITLPL